MGRGAPFGRGGRGGARCGGGGRGRRNEYYATGLMGWQRATMAAAPGSEALSDSDRLERIETKLTEALDRLSKLERVE
jgi:hypothetical protein